MKTSRFIIGKSGIKLTYARLIAGIHTYMLTHCDNSSPEFCCFGEICRDDITRALCNGLTPHTYIECVMEK